MVNVFSQLRRRRACLLKMYKSVNYRVCDKIDCIFFLGKVYLKDKDITDTHLGLEWPERGRVVKRFSALILLSWVGKRECCLPLTGSF